MNNIRHERHWFVAGCVLSLCALCVAMFVEAVAEAGAFDFSSLVSRNEFWSSIPLVRPRHFRIELPDVVALLGIVAALTGYLFLRRRLPTWALLAYLVVFLLYGGFYGLIAIGFGWVFQPINGEFFQDGVPKLLAYGIWTACLLALVFRRFAARADLAPT